MAWSQIKTKLPLDSWAKFYGIHPLHFNGIYLEDSEQQFCGGVWNQYEWQASDRIGREAVAQAILMAEDLLERYLGFRLLPSWEVEEWHSLPRPIHPETFSNLLSLRGFPNSVRTDWGHYITAGIQKTTLVRDDASVVYNDADLDNYDETATVVVTSPLITSSNYCFLRLFYPDSEIEIRPFTVTLSGTTATFKFRREQAVVPEMLNGIEVLSLKGDENENFLKTLDVKLVENDNSQQVRFSWSYDNQISVGFQSAVEPRLGEVQVVPGIYDSNTMVWTRAWDSICYLPERVQLWYYAGYRDRNISCPYTNMASAWQHTVAILSAIFLDRPPCACGGVSDTWEHWSRDMAFIHGAEELSRYQVSKGDLDNPFGTKLGGITAWRRVKSWIQNQP